MVNWQHFMLMSSVKPGMGFYMCKCSLISLYKKGHCEKTGEKKIKSRRCIARIMCAVYEVRMAKHWTYVSTLEMIHLIFKDIIHLTISIQVNLGATS